MTPPVATPACTLRIMTASAPGAIGIMQLSGDVEPVLASLSTRSRWPIGSMGLAEPGGIDECLLVRLDEQTAQVMPHGGPRVRQRLLAHFAELGIVIEYEHPDPGRLYPEAADLLEACMLQALSTAASPLAIDLLLDQPERWRHPPEWTDEDDARSTRLNHLLAPPGIVLVGPPNTGKSTLLNALTGREKAIAHDAPGTTRDFVACEIDLGGLVVLWHDTPGRRFTDDAIEAEAIALSRRLLDEADLLISLTDPGTPWIELERAADLRIGSKSDLGTTPDADLCICAVDGTGMPGFVEAVRDALVSRDDLECGRPWRFHESLAHPGSLQGG